MIKAIVESTNRANLEAEMAMWPNGVFHRLQQYVRDGVVYSEREVAVAYEAGQ